MNRHFLAGAAQVAPAYFDLDQSLSIAEKWIDEGGRCGLKLDVFPESWLPGYPFWLDDSPDMGLWDHAPTKVLFRCL